jgi:integrase
MTDMLSHDEKYEHLIGKPSHNAGPRRFLKDEEIEAIKDHFDWRIENDNRNNLALRDFTLMMFAMYTGLRINEILRLNIRDVMTYSSINNEFRIFESKTGTTRQIKSQPGLKEILSAFIDHYGHGSNKDAPLFQSISGTRLGTRQASNIFRNTFERCSLTGSLGCHSARKTFAKKAMELSGNSIPQVQLALNHKDMATTYHYVNSLDKEKCQDEIVMKMEF